MLVSYDPASGDVVGEFDVYDDAQVAQVVAAARAAGGWWSELGFAGRAERLRAFAAQLARDIHDIADLVHRENGKTIDDALLELLPVVERVRWVASHAMRVLRQHSVAPGLLTANLAANVVYRPYGVVGVIGPWNYPVYAPMGAIVDALGAGNAVVFKPSEYTPAVAVRMAEIFADVVPEAPVFQTVTGFAETGAALCRSGVDKVAFTGSAATGRRVMVTCAERLTPVVLECGGNDPLVVADDADVDAAVDAALWGGLVNGGQTCVGVERIYVVESLYDDFVRALVSEVGTITAGESYGPITVPGQLEVIRRHVADALDRGAVALVAGLDAIRAPYVEPIVLADVPADALVEREETFGPVLTVTRVPDVDTAVERANGTAYGLGAAVFSARRGVEIADRMRAGMVSINAPVSYVGVPGLPFGGVGGSGFGRVHGADGLREFAWPQAISRQRFASPLRVMTFRRSRQAVSRLVTGLRAVRGR